MKKEIIKKVVSFGTAVIMAAPLGISAGAEADSVFKSIYFDNLPTNLLNVDGITVEGSANCRVDEENGNKAFRLPGSTDNVMRAECPGIAALNSCSVSFSIGHRVMHTGGAIGFGGSNGSSVSLITVNPDGSLESDNGRKCGAIPLSGYSDIKIDINGEDGLFDLYVNGRCTLENEELPSAVKKAEAIVIEASAAANPEAYVLVDNIAVTNGAYVPLSKQWNSETLDFVPVDEGLKSNNVYLNEAFSEKDELKVKIDQKTNRIEYTKDEKSGNGYLTIEQAAANDAMVDVNLNPGSKHLMLELDIMHSGQAPQRATLFYLRDNSSSPQVNSSVGTFQAGGIIGYPNGSLTIPKNEWHTVSVYLNLQKSTVSVWIDGKLVRENFSLGVKMKTLSMWRLYLQGKGTEGKFYVDNMKVYDGTEPRTLGEDEKGSEVSIYNDDGAKNILNGKKALSPYSSQLWHNNKKTETDKPCLPDGEETLVSKDTFEKLFGETVSVSGNDITLGSGAVMAVGSKTLKTGGRTVSLLKAPEMVGETLYLPVTGYGKAVLGADKFYDDEHGLYIVSNSKVNAADERLKEANLYMFFKRRSKEELGKMLAGNMGGDLTKHPRLVANEADFTRLRSEIETNPHKKKWFEAIRKSADALLEKPVSEYNISNGRLLNVSNETFNRAQYLGFTYQITRDKRYAQRLLDELKAVCSFPDWHTKHFLDTGTMAQAVGLGFDWIYDIIPEAERQFIMEQSKKLALDEARDGYFGHPNYSSTFWLRTETNWGVIVNGGILTLATAIAELDSDYAMEVAQNAMRSMEYTIYCFAPDGSWYEGPNYWNYMLRNYAYSAAAYETAYGEVHESANYKGSLGIANFRMFVSDPNDIVNNFNDSEGGRIASEGQMYLAKVKHDLPLMKDRAQYFDKYGGNGSVYDIIWFDTEAENATLNDYPLESYYRDTELVSFRQSWTAPESLWVSATGGSADAAHSHVDTGTFVMTLNNVRWAIDPGKEDYSYAAYNPAVEAGYNSYYYYRRKGEGHNIVVINPDDKLELDQKAFAKFTTPIVGKGRAYTTLDLSEAYAKNVTEYIRGYMIADGRRSFTVRDEITLKKNNSELYWFMHTEGDVVVLDNNTAVITQNGEQLKVSFLTNAADCELSVMEAKKLPQSPQFLETNNNGMCKLALKIKASGKVNITAKMAMFDESPMQTPIDDTPISQWSVDGDDKIAESSLKSPARLSAIKVNGENIFGFNPEVYSYKYYLSKSEAEPVFTAESAGRTEIAEYPQSDGSRMIELRAYDSNGRYRPYIVRTVPYTPRYLGEYECHQTVGAEVSSEQSESGNVRANSYDGDLNTRWSAYGRNEWMVHSLGAERKIDAIGLAFWKGNQRIFSFEIYVSDDGVNYTKVLERETSGTTEEMEIYELEKPVTARFVKFVGHGSNAAVNGEWNNVLEMAALEKR